MDNSLTPSEMLLFIPLYLFFLLQGLSVPGYVIVQIFVLVRLSGVLRWVAALPLLFMVPCYIWFAFGISQGGDNNLAPLLLLVPSPFAFLYVVVFAFLPVVKQTGGPRPAGR